MANYSLLLYSSFFRLRIILEFNTSEPGSTCLPFTSVDSEGFDCPAQNSRHPHPSSSKISTWELGKYKSFVWSVVVASWLPLHLGDRLNIQRRVYNLGSLGKMGSWTMKLRYLLAILSFTECLAVSCLQGSSLSFREDLCFLCLLGMPWVKLYCLPCFFPVHCPFFASHSVPLYHHSRTFLKLFLLLE